MALDGAPYVLTDEDSAGQDISNILFGGMRRHTLVDTRLRRLRAVRYATLLARAQHLLQWRRSAAFGIGALNAGSRAGRHAELDQELAHLVDRPLGDAQVRIHQWQAFRRLDHRAEALDVV